MTTILGIEIANILLDPRFSDRSVKQVYLGNEHAIPVDEAMNPETVNFLWIVFDKEESERLGKSSMFRLDFIPSVTPSDPVNLKPGP